MPSGGRSKPTISMGLWRLRNVYHASPPTTGTPKISSRGAARRNAFDRGRTTATAERSPPSSAFTRAMRSSQRRRRPPTCRRASRSRSSACATARLGLGGPLAPVRLARPDGAQRRARHVERLRPLSRDRRAPASRRPRPQGVALRLRRQRGARRYQRRARLRHELHRTTPAVASLPRITRRASATQQPTRRPISHRRRHGGLLPVRLATSRVCRSSGRAPGCTIDRSQLLGRLVVVVRSRGTSAHELRRPRARHCRRARDREPRRSQQHALEPLRRALVRPDDHVRPADRPSTTSTGADVAPC